MDKSLPAQSITYEDIYNTPSALKFSFHNNTSCTIIVDADCVTPHRVIKLPNGSIRIDKSEDSIDGVVLPLHYEVQDVAHGRTPKAGYGWGDSFCDYELKAGESVFFTVPSRRFDEQLDLAIRFRYDWDKNGYVEHRVYFYLEDLPPKVRQSLKRLK